jgi:uncharacterized membrane protein YphA (DoxX/SURF4 family)
MGTRTARAAAPAHAPAPAAAVHTTWRPLTRVAFRFCVIYFLAYALLTQIVGGVFLLPGFQLPALGHVWPFRELTFWLAEHVFGFAPPYIYIGNSGDTAFHWVQAAWLVTGAVIGTAAWSALDARRLEYTTLHKWFRLFLRFALAAQMFYFGMAKVIPTQFRPPALITLVEDVGNLSLSNMLWVSIGAAPAYQMFTGVAEVLAGLLLVLPQTTPLGAMLALADMALVFMLNMSYDFGLKQISFHLILISLVLLAPDLQRVANVLLLNRPADRSAQPPLFRSPAANRRAQVAQVLVGIYLLGMFTNVSIGFYNEEGGPGSPKSPLYGIWDVRELAIDGETRPPALNDYDRRWRRVIFDSPVRIIFQRTDDSFATYGVSIDTSAQRMTLRKGGSQTWTASFTYRMLADDEMVLEGRMDGLDIRMRLELVGLDTFRLLNSRFRWIRPPDPYAD